jgi:hypothetical protein
MAALAGTAAGVAILLVLAPFRAPSSPAVTLAPSVLTGSVPDPAPALAAPVLLSDGTPVFAVRRVDGTAGVVAAVSTHLGRFVAWCPGSRTFVDRPHDSFFDDRGRWLTGPAQRDLRSADATQVDSAGEGRRLLPGPLQEHLSRSTDADRTSQPRCDGEPVSHGDPGLWESHTVRAALARPGEYSLVTGTLTFGSDGTSFCPAGLNTEPPCEAVPVLSLFHNPQHEFLRGHLEGQFLVKAHHDAFSDVIMIRTVGRVEDSRAESVGRG